MRKYNFISFLMLLMLGLPLAASADSFFLNAGDLELGKTETLQFILENTQEYYGFQADVTLPAGLEAVKGSDGQLDITLSTRAEGGEYHLTSNQLADGTIKMAAFSGNLNPFTESDGVLVNLKVSVAESFTGGTVEVKNIKFIDSQDKDVKFDSSSATYGVTVSGITLDKAELSLLEGASATLTATITPASATDKSITWTSSDASVATVDANGNVKAIALGEVTITATCGAVSATCKVTVVPTPVESITLSNASLALTEGESATLTATVAPANATDKSVSWTSSDAAVATVDSNGKVTAIKAGSATITANSANGKTASCVVTVTAKAPEVIEVTGISLDKTELSLTEGDVATLTATIAPANATDKSVSWTSSDAAVATVDSNGKVSAVKAGTATITASSSNGKTASCVVTVAAKAPETILVESLTIDPTVWSGEEGSEFKITATVLPEDATDKSLTWTSSDETVASVDGEGNVKVLKEGNCTITVATTDGSNMTAECVITSVAGVEAIFGEDAVVDVYDMNGVLVKRACERGELKELLTPGVYILRSGNATVKAVVKD